MVVASEARQGYYSLVRWRADIARDEEKNIGVLLLDPGHGAHFRPAPVSAVSQKLAEQGILDAALVSLRAAVEATSFALDDMRQLHQEFQRSLLVTEPRPVAVWDLQETVRALYSTLVASRQARGPRAATKSGVTDSLVEALRSAKWGVRRGSYRGDFLFDVVVDQPPPGASSPDVLSVVSYGAPRKDWTPVEKDAGYFACGVQMLELAGMAAVVPPRPDAATDAKRSHDRIVRMLDRASVPIVDASDLSSSAVESGLFSLL